MHQRYTVLHGVDQESLYLDPFWKHIPESIIYNYIKLLWWGTAPLGDSKHSHIRTYHFGFRLVKFLVSRCKMRNQAENVNKNVMFLKFVLEILYIIHY